jgi:hypothetical protein
MQRPHWTRAQKIVAELNGMTSEHQSLALKFAIETLGLQLPAALLPAGQTVARWRCGRNDPAQEGRPKELLGSCVEKPTRPVRPEHEGYFVQLASRQVTEDVAIDGSSRHMTRAGKTI